MKTQVTEYQGITIKNKRNVKYVKSAINWLIKYNEANNLRDIADGDDDNKAYNKANRECERTFDKYLEAIDTLPEYQIKLIQKSKFY